MLYKLKLYESENLILMWISSLYVFGIRAVNPEDSRSTNVAVH